MSREAAARKCVEKLVSDLERIKKEYINEGSYGTAGCYWQRALFGNGFYTHRESIKELHCGNNFVHCAEILLDDLKKESFNNSAYEMLKVCAVQTKLKGGN